MSRYAPTDYRPVRDRSRSPGSRFPDRRPSAALIYNGRAPDSGRGGADAPRGPRSQFDNGRPPLSGGPNPAASSRGGYPGRGEVRELRDAPPLSSDRGRNFKDRAFDNRDRLPSPRDRSPLRNFRDSRDYPPPRDPEIPRARRGSRDGPPSAGSGYSDAPSSFANPPPFRDGFAPRGRGRGDSGFRGGRGRGGRMPDERDLFRRDRSPPPPRWARDLSRDGRDLDRREERRFDRREEDRRPEWTDREREADRPRREQPQPQPRLETRKSNDSLASVPAQPVAAPHVNPERLALLESSGADISVRRPSLTPSVSASREPRREHPELPAYLNGRAETTISRYGSRGSSPPTQAPPVPAFTLSYASTAQSGTPSQISRQINESRLSNVQEDVAMSDIHLSEGPERSAPPTDAPSAPKVPPQAPKAQAAEPPPAAPKAPRALDTETSIGFGSRLHGVRSWEAPASASHAAANAAPSRAEALGLHSGPTPTISSSTPVPQSRAMHHSQPVSPAAQQTTRVAEFTAPTGPKVSRTLSTQPNTSSRPPFAFNQSDVAAAPASAGYMRNNTPPPPSAPSGPRNRAVSVSPKVSASAIPTAPRANRPPLAPRGAERGPVPPVRVVERINASQPRGPPTAPRAAQWNQWRRPELANPADKTVPAKRDHLGEEKGRPPYAPGKDDSSGGPTRGIKSETEDRARPVAAEVSEKMEIDSESAARRSGASTGHSAQQSFFGKPTETSDEGSGAFDAVDESMSTSEDEDLEELEGPAPFEAKFEDKKRELEAQLVDLNSRACRATTPLESIARLVKLGDKDLEKFKEREQDMEIDEHNDADGLAPPTHSSESDGNADIVTPKNEDAPAVDIHETNEVITHPARDYRRPSPEIVSLPYLLKGSQPSFNESRGFHDNADRLEYTKDAVASALDEDMEDAQDQEADGADEFAEIYRKWRERCERLDREREAEEALERQQSMEPRPELDASYLTIPTAPPEGRRSHKNNSEYEFEQALKQSEETARLEQEKADLEARKIQADMEKEAIIPDQQTAKEMERTCFIDNNCWRDPKTLTLVFAYEPPADNFTENEQQIFIAAFKETPKKWTEIASLLPDREPKDCIRHYYANKWDGRFRDNRKRGKGKRGRGGKLAPRGKGSAAMADMSRAEDLVQNVSDSGRPKRAAAPTNFGERELDAKASLAKDSPVRKLGAGAKENGDLGSEKPVKRRKGLGEKSGRKPKAAATQQPLAQLAAAPSMSMSPNNRFMPSNLPLREEPALVQSLEDASLLANLQSGHRIHSEAHSVYLQEGFVPSVSAAEELERGKSTVPTPSSKPSASSYWSVPEQSDFVKYIAHFGTDFAAIAAHMGTKTQTMIKNHYQRSIDGGNRPELEQSAVTANDRRDRGEDIGAPPTPTPINKRKYDNPPTAAPRALAPQSDSMDIDEPAAVNRPSIPKHATSPPQFSMQARFTSSAQSTPVQAPRTAPSPVTTPVTVPTPLVQPAAIARGLQHPLGSRLSMFGESRPDPRPSLGSASSLRHLQQATPTSQPAQPSRPVQDAHDIDFILKLKQEQERAIRMQGHYHEQERQERIEPFSHRSSLQQIPALQRSPATQLMSAPQERKPAHEERPPSPPRPFFPLGGTARRSLGGSPAFGHLPLASNPIAANRMAFNPSPPKKEEPRPSSVFSVPPAPPPLATPAPPPELPKRSNLLSLLNSEPEEPKPAKRISSDLTASGIPLQRTASPAHHPLAGPPATPLSSLSQPRRDTFGQSALPQSRFSHSAFGQPTATSSPQLAKQEPPMSATVSQQQQPPQKQDWATRVLSHSSQPASNSSTPAPALERDVRPYFQHRPSMLGGLNGAQRQNPSPPPHALLNHSRTPSLTAQGPTQPPREQRGFLSGQQSAQQQGPTSSSIQSSAFQQQQPPPPFGQSQLGQQAQNHAHHAHNNSIGSGFPGMHHRNISREDHLRSEQQANAARAQQREQDWMRAREERRMAEEQERRIHDEREQQRRVQEDRRMQEQQQRERQIQEERRAQEERRMQEEHDDRRRREQQYYAQREHEQRQQQQQQHQHSFGRPLPSAMQPPSHFGGGGFEPPPRSMSGMGSIREQSMREAENLYNQENERMRRDAAFRENREREQADEIRRHEQAIFPPRRTPMGGPGGFGPPPPPGQPRR